MVHVGGWQWQHTWSSVHRPVHCSTGHLLWCTHTHNIMTLRSKNLIRFVTKWIGCDLFHCISR